MDLAARPGRPVPSGSAGPRTRSCSAAAGPCCPSRTRSTTRRPGFQHAAPGTVLRSRDVELALPRTDSPEGARHPAALPHHRPERRAGGHRHHRAGARRTRATSQPATWCPTSAPSTPCPSRCFPSYALRRRAKAVGALAQFEYLLIAAALAEGWVVSVPDHEGRDGMWGTPHEPGYRVLDGLRATLNFERFGLRRGQPGRPVGLLRRRAGQRLGRRDVRRRTPRSSTSSAPCSARRSATSATPSAGSTAPSTSALPALVVAALAKIYPGPRPGHRRARHRRGHGDAAAAGADDHRRRRSCGCSGNDMDDLVDPPLEEMLVMPEVQDVFDGIKLGTTAPTPPVLIVQAVHDSDHLRRRHRRTGRHLYAAAARRSPITATCSASTCCCTRCRRR